MSANDSKKIAEEHGHRWHGRLLLMVTYAVFATGLIAFIIGVIYHVIAAIAMAVGELNAGNPFPWEIFHLDELAIVGGGTVFIVATVFIYQITFESYYRNYCEGIKTLEAVSYERDQSIARNGELENELAEKNKELVQNTGSMPSSTCD